MLWPPTNPILVIIAVFIFFAAGQEYRYVQVQEAAKSYGFGGGWSPFTSQWNREPEGDPDDRVIISPPPYKDGPDDEANLRPFRKRNPFSDLFGQ